MDARDRGRRTRGALLPRVLRAQARALRKGGDDVKINYWTTQYGTVENARKAGVKGRVVVVHDGTAVSMRSTHCRNASSELAAFLSTADYSEAARAFDVACTIFSASDRVASTAYDVVSGRSRR